ncbi:flagellar protein FlgN [Virgibacillus dakarensis]|uniref:Flagellar protein FlgN n=1 Tax=Lentibacillus populi TaxID=1827502 RepID=A0A9W5U0E9_9BACI|nr:flagellar protein FlgN [Lentibacillus populi]MTW86386.1 flagellar protein FlgN [Virgibacillus dakarensis]GGB55305.1 hypothetical protein GCM10011409_36160 [Lentibacillus populi]
MTIQTIIQSLEKLVTIHESLLELSEQKTVVIKEGSVEKLQSLLIKERRYVRTLGQEEEKRQKEVEDWFSEQRISGKEVTITTMLNEISGEETGTEMAQIANTLTEVIVKLKQQEQLNQALIQQSMQFVELSLDMIDPSIKKMNYGDKHANESANRSVFDSKA